MTEYSNTGVQSGFVYFHEKNPENGKKKFFGQVTF
jgi:hypothetical protein